MIVVKILRYTLIGCLPTPSQSLWPGVPRACLLLTESLLHPGAGGEAPPGPHGFDGWGRGSPQTRLGGCCLKKEGVLGRHKKDHSWEFNVLLWTQ